VAEENIQETNALQVQLPTLSNQEETTKSIMDA